VGDELLLGATTDTNAAWLGRWLAARGLPVVRRWTVPDQEEAIGEAVSAALDQARLVVVTGGLGPTPDDRTRDAVAALLDRALAEDPDVLEGIARRFRARGIEELPEPNRRVAQVPRGARLLANPHGTAPGLALEVPDAGSDGRGGGVVLLPGVPREMSAIVDRELPQLLTDWFGGDRPPIHTRTLHTTGIPESLLAHQLTDHLPVEGPVEVAFLPDRRGVDLRLTATGLDAADARRRLDEVEGRLAPVLEPWRFQAAGGDLVEAVSAALLARDLRLAAAESCTGGLLAQRMTSRPGSSRLFLGGVVAYANEAKVELLGVDPALLERHGAVSEEVAKAMALGVCRRFGAEVGVSLTGVAGPGGGSAEKPVGTVCHAVAQGGSAQVRRERFPGDREEVRDRSTQAALALILRVLEGRTESSEVETDAGP